MLTVQMPMLLALLGTALMAIVIFAPSRIPAPITTSFAPPPMPPAVEHWEPPADTVFQAWELPSNAPAWPLSIDARAIACDASARLELIEALATLRSPWAATILRRALDEESDPAVRAAADAALRA